MEIEERKKSKKKILTDLLYEYRRDKEDLEVGRTIDEMEREELKKEILDTKRALLSDVELIKELAEEGVREAEMFINENMAEIVTREVAKSVGEETRYQIDDMRKRMNQLLKQVEKRVEKLSDVIPDVITRSEFKSIMDELVSAVRQGVPTAAPSYAETPKAEIPRGEAIRKARELFNKGDRVGATKILMKGGYTPLQIEAIMESFTRMEDVAGGIGVTLKDIREVIREEMRSAPSRVATDIESVEIEWIRDPMNPLCWDNYTLGLCMIGEAEKKLAIHYGISISEVQQRRKSGVITENEWQDALDSISHSEIIDMFIKTGKVIIIPRNPSFERDLMGLPFSWGNGHFFKLSPLGRRNSGWSLWQRLDTIAKVVQYSVENGDWNSKMFMEYGIPTKFIKQCIALARNEKSIIDITPVKSYEYGKEEPKKEEKPAGPEIKLFGGGSVG